METGQSQSRRPKTTGQRMFTSPRQDMAADHIMWNPAISTVSGWSASPLNGNIDHSPATGLRSPNSAMYTSASFTKSVNKVKSGELHTAYMFSKTQRVGNMENYSKIVSSVGPLFRDGNEDYQRAKQRAHNSKRAVRTLEIIYPKAFKVKPMGDALKEKCIKETHNFFVGAEKEKLRKQDKQQEISEKLAEMIYHRKEKNALPVSVSSTPYITKKFVNTFTSRFDGEQSIGKMHKSVFNETLRRYQRDGDQFTSPDFEEIAPKDMNSIITARQHNNLGVRKNNEKSPSMDKQEDKEMEEKMEAMIQLDFLLQKYHLKGSFAGSDHHKKGNRLPNRVKIKALRLNLVE